MSYYPRLKLINMGKVSQTSVVSAEANVFAKKKIK